MTKHAAATCLFTLLALAPLGAQSPPAPPTQSAGASAGPAAVPVGTSGAAATTTATAAAANNPDYRLGAGDKIGSIEPGKIADLQVTDGDPLEVATHCEQVILNGKLMPMESRQTRLFHKYDNRPRGKYARKPAAAAASSTIQSGK